MGRDGGEVPTPAVAGGGRPDDVEVDRGLRDRRADGLGERRDQPQVRLFLAATEDDEWTAYRALGALGASVEGVRREVEGLARDEAQGSLPE